MTDLQTAPPSADLRRLLTGYAVRIQEYIPRGQVWAESGKETVFSIDDKVVVTQYVSPGKRSIVSKWAYDLSTGLLQYSQHCRIHPDDLQRLRDVEGIDADRALRTEAATLLDRLHGAQLAEAVGRLKGLIG